jgi:transposase
VTKPGGKLAEVTRIHLRQRLAEETDPKAIKRLVAALEYKDGLSPAKIEEKYGWPTQTIYSWLNRFEERGVEAALRDKPRPGRRPLLSPPQRRQLFAALNAPPTEVGYDAPAWTPALVNTYLNECLEVTYSGEHCRRLLHEAGLSEPTARPYHYKADPAEHRRWRSEFKKSGRY